MGSEGSGTEGTMSIRSRLQRLEAVAERRPPPKRVRDMTDDELVAALRRGTPTKRPQEMTDDELQDAIHRGTRCIDLLQPPGNKSATQWTDAEEQAFDLIEARRPPGTTSAAEWTDAERREFLGRLFAEWGGVLQEEFQHPTPG